MRESPWWRNGTQDIKEETGLTKYQAPDKAGTGAGSPKVGTAPPRIAGVPEDLMGSIHVACIDPFSLGTPMTFIRDCVNVVRLRHGVSAT
jgi:hypothetical protein